MGTFLANTCWPGRFAAKWLAFFGVALFVGTIFGIKARLSRPKAAPPAAVAIQGVLRVNIKYAGEAGYQPTNATIYFANSPQEMKKHQNFPVKLSEMTFRTLDAGSHYNFMVQPLTPTPKYENAKPLGEPVPWHVTWPDRNLPAHDYAEVPPLNIPLNISLEKPVRQR